MNKYKEYFLKTLAIFIGIVFGFIAVVFLEECNAHMKKRKLYTHWKNNRVIA